MGNGPGPNDEKRVDLVFEGGGIKAIGLVGALSVIEERGYQVQNVAGTSGGALLGAMYQSGYSAREIKQFVRDLWLPKFMDTTWIGRIPKVGGVLRFLGKQGVYKGDVFLNELRSYLSEQGVRTFDDLICDPDSENSLFRYSLQVTVTDLTLHRMLVLPRDAHMLGVPPGQFDVALALRMSASIPIFFEPVRFRERRGGDQDDLNHLIVDGGMLSDFPVWLFDIHPGEVPPWPTFGLLLDEPLHVDTNLSTQLGTRRSVWERLKTTKMYGEAMVRTASAHNEEQDHSPDGVLERTIQVPTLSIAATEFGISDEDIDRLYESGRVAATRFLDSWDFERYKQRFR